MMFLCSSDSTGERHARALAQETVTEDFVSCLIREFGLRYTPERFSANLDRIKNNLTSVFEKLYYVLGEDITGKRILDLGCGALGGTTEYSFYEHGRFHPWFCRALYKLGADVFGIDIGDLNGENFPHLQANLLEPRTLEFIPDSSVYFINAHMLFNSPELEKRVTGIEKSRDASTQASWELGRVLKPQLLRILRQDGCFVSETPKTDLGLI